MIIHLVYPIRFLKLKNKIKYYISLDTGLMFFDESSKFWDFRLELLGFGIEIKW